VTFPLAAILFGVMLIYCGVKGRSVASALLGHSVAASSGGLLSSSTPTGTASSAAGASTVGSPGQTVGGYNPGGAIAT
jgi:hypothetical protein